MIEPKISVIVPVYNSRKYLRKCLDSIRFQTYGNLEIICVDDGSDDGSVEILEEYKGLDSRISVYTQERAGAACARNAGMEHASGDYIAFVDADDWILLNLYQTFVDDLNKLNRDIDIYVFNGCAYMAQGNDIFPINYFEISDWNKHESKYTIHVFDDCQKPFTRNFAVMNKIYRREFLKSKNIKFPPGLKYEDMPFCIESFLAASSIIINDEIFYRYRQNVEGSASVEVVPKVFDIFKVVDLVEQHVMSYGLYEDYKYALFQYKYNSFFKNYAHCPKNLRESYFNEMKFRLLSAETQDLDSRVVAQLRNYDIFKLIKNSPRREFDKFFDKFSHQAN